MMQVYANGPPIGYPDVSGNAMIDMYGEAVNQYFEASFLLKQDTRALAQVDHPIKGAMDQIRAERSELNQWVDHLGKHWFIDRNHTAALFPLGAQVQVQRIPEMGALISEHRHLRKPKVLEACQGAVVAFAFNFIGGGKMQLEQDNGKLITVDHLYSQARRARAVDLTIVSVPPVQAIPNIPTRPQLKIVK